MRRLREGRGFWSSRAPDRTPSDARMRADSSARAAGGLCWATRDRAHGSGWKRFARPCARTTASELRCKSRANRHRAHFPAARDRAALEVGLARRIDCLLQPAGRFRASRAGLRLACTRGRPLRRSWRRACRRGPQPRRRASWPSWLRWSTAKWPPHPVPTLTASPAIGVAFTGGVLDPHRPVRAAMTARLAVLLPRPVCASLPSIRWKGRCGAPAGLTVQVAL